MCPIIAVTRSATASRQMHLHFGVHPLYYSKDKVGSPSRCTSGVVSLILIQGEDDSWSKDVDNRFYWAMEQGKKVCDVV